MHTIKVDLTLDQATALEEQLLIIANDRGAPLNFSILRLPTRALLTGYFNDKVQAAQQLALLPLPGPVQHGFLRDRDWQDSVKKHFRPFAYRGIAWAPVWMKKIPAKLNAKKVIRLDPGMAFGTGNHPTTRLCLRRLVETMTHYTRPSVLDIGCGSGILAITAAAMGASSAAGFDLDEHSITVATRNRRINKSKAKFWVGDVYKDKLPPADIVLANLLANLIADNARKLWRTVKPGGTLILSGLLKEELQRTAAHFPAQAKLSRLGKWGVLVIRRP